jgi:hydroxyacylglutathione hydrolase
VFYTIPVFLKTFFEPTLAQTSYLIGCARTGEAIVIDPNRDVEQYIAAAAAEKARIAHVTETHIHADFVSGSRELAKQTRAKLYLSDEGGDEWTYGFAGVENVVRIKHGDRITVGNVLLDVIHTPGHTPEHVTFLVTDSVSASAPIAAATGDFLFVGDVGRPDLLEVAANFKGTMEVSARALYGSLQAFVRHPDWLQIWPGHGAGSACGKGISAIPHSTLGYEKRFNWAFQADSEDAFVRDVLAGQPEPPKYFAAMKAINKQGPAILGGFLRPPHVDADQVRRLTALLTAGTPVVDMRAATAFALGHVPGTINIPLTATFTTYAGWLLPYHTDIHLIVDGSAPHAVDTAVRNLALIGLDRVAGYFDASVLDAWTTTGQRLGTIAQIGPADLAASLAHRGVTLIDVRNATEWQSGHIAGARHIPLGYLLDRVADVPRDKPVVLQCLTGGRSAIGASLLRARGYETVVNLTGGISEWIAQGYPTVGGNG